MSLKASKAKRVARAKEFIAEWRKDGCIICGEKEPCVLDSHHVDPSTKEHAVADLLRDARMERLEAELRKTVTLCSNCHRKVHAGVISLDKQS